MTRNEESLESLYELIASMAISWNDIKRRIGEHVDVMIEHLVKIYYYHDFSQYLWHWAESVRKGFERIPKDSKTNKLPTYNQIFDYIWNVEFDGDIDDFHRGIVGDINEFYFDVPPIKIEDINYEGFRKFALEYIRLLATKLSTNGKIYMSDVMDFISNYDYGFSLK